MGTEPGRFVTAAHLGGYVTGGDPGTWYPDMWQWLIGGGVTSMLDIGCGDGATVQWFSDHGCRAEGVDGLAPGGLDYHQIDFTKEKWHPARSYDLGWCAEFVEHVPEEFIPNFLPAFQACEVLMMTHAVPGQPGWNHVNCQPADYWIKVMETIGYDHDELLSAKTWALAQFNTTEDNYFRKTGMAFRRRWW